MRSRLAILRLVLLPSCLLLAACAGAPPPSATVTPPASPEKSAAADTTFMLTSRALAEVRRINVHVPPGVSPAGLPILYMPDGGTEEDFPHVVAAVDAGVRSLAVAPVIVVGVENTERRRDMTGPTTVESDKKIAPRVGGSERFRAFFRDELIPEIDRRFPGHGRTAIIGESLAGLFVVETFFVAPGTFDVYVAISPSLWWNDHRLVRTFADWLAAHPTSDRTLYLTVAGDDDRDDAIAQLAASLGASPPSGLVFTFEPRPRETHATIYKGSEDAILRRLFPLVPRAVSS